MVEPLTSLFASRNTVNKIRPFIKKLKNRDCHFDRETMELFEATVKDLQAKGNDVAVPTSTSPCPAPNCRLTTDWCLQLHFTDFGSCKLILHSKGIKASPEGQLGGYGSPIAVPLS